MRVASATDVDDEVREPVLSPVDRVSELLFGLFMALSFVGAVSVAESGRNEIRAMYAAALGCNLAWGLVDAVMYLVRTVSERGRALALIRAVRATRDSQAGCRLIERTVSRDFAGLVAPAEIEAIRERMLELPTLPERPRLRWHDLRAALAIFLLVVVATIPVVLPFAFVDDVAIAKHASRAIALVMLFVGGLALGRYAGYGSWKAGLLMVGLGMLLVAAIRALGG
jgi:VIT1/CCC1 family predicted Fe2+/Mn2+ transporter